MNSLGNKCSPLKHEYDKCFNEWYSGRFLKGEGRNDGVPCRDLMATYQECLKVALQEEGVDESISHQRREWDDVRQSQRQAEQRKEHDREREERAKRS